MSDNGTKKSGIWITKTQVWILSFFVVFFLLLFLSRITRTEETAENTPAGNTVPQTNMSSEEINAPDMITRLGCRSCHGADLTGTRMGPQLTALQQNWTRDELINYLRNPNSYMDKDRFKEFRQKYPGIMMPSFNNVDVKDLGKIADYLLAL